MRSKTKAVCMMLAMVVVGIVSGCGGSSTAPQSSSAGSTAGAPSTSTSTALQSAGAVLYDSKCAGCHGKITASSIVAPTSLARIQGAIQGNRGGMGMFSSLSTADIQSIADAVNNPSAAMSPPPSPPPPTTTTTADGAALYASNCAACHGSLATSSKTGLTLTRLQTAISSNIGGMGFLASMTSAQQQSIVTALNPGSTPAPTPLPTPTPTVDGAALYTANCAGCHGALATSAKTGITLVRLQNAISGNTGNMGFLSTLTSTQQQAIVAALAVSTPPSPTPTPTPTPSTDGATLYAANCASCHGVLATSAKAGATATRIQTAINNNTGGMGSLASLTTTQVSAIATSLAVITPTPTPTPACGSCHAIPPATGHHSTHKNEGIACATCHGSGYSTTTVNATTHNNGVKNLTTTIGWNAASRSCSNSCHSTKSW